MPPSSSFSAKKSEKFYQAASSGKLPLVRSLSVDRQVDLSWRDDAGFTPFRQACYNGHVDVVRYLLGFHDNHHREPIDYNLANETRITPLSVACYLGHEKVVEALLEDERVDVNLADQDEETPLWRAAANGHVGVVKVMLASGREVDVLKQDDDGRTAAEVAKVAGEKKKFFSESDEALQRRKAGCQLIVPLLEAFQKDPQAVRKQLRRELEIDDRLAGELFALVVYLSGGYLSLSPTNKPQREHRFLSIASRLPPDLQMILSNRVFDVARSVVKRSYSEKGFMKFAKGV